MRAYSVDLRQKVIDAHNQQQGSQRQLAKRFRVSLTFIESLLAIVRMEQLSLTACGEADQPS